MTIFLRKLAYLVVIASALLVCSRQLRVAAAQENSADKHGRGIAEVTTKFSDTISPPRTKGPATPLRVELKEWHLAGQGVSIEMPEGFYVAHLMWGSVSIQIADKTTVPSPGDFWTVEKGARMAVTIKKPGEEALIQTFSVSLGH